MRTGTAERHQIWRACRRSSELIVRGASAVPGFVAYHVIRTADGGCSISVYEDKAGAEESTRRAAAYIKENLESVAAGPPEVMEGESVIHFTR